jgi:hypothetical protein
MCQVFQQYNVRKSEFFPNSSLKFPTNYSRMRVDVYLNAGVGVGYEYAIFV